MIYSLRIINEKLKVEGGWIVHSYHFYVSTFFKIIKINRMKITGCFVPDATHCWKTEES